MNPSQPHESIASEILVSLATPALLLTLLGSKSMARLMQDLGQVSEEVFRGDRLPLLPLPHDVSNGSGEIVDGE